MSKVLSVLARVLLLWPLLTLTVQAREQAGAALAETQNIVRDIAAAPLAEQIASLAEQAGIHVLSRVPLQQYRAGHALQGTHKLASALDALLQPHGLRWTRMDERTVRIERARESLMLTVSPVEIEAERIEQVTPANAQASWSPPLLAERTAAGIGYDQGALAALPKRSLAQSLTLTPNAYGQGSRLSLRGIERDGFAGQTSSVRLDGMILSNAMLDAFQGAPPLSQLQINLGPQLSSSAPNFAGEVRLDTALPSHELGGGAEFAQGPRQQGLSLRQQWSDQQDHAISVFGERHARALEPEDREAQHHLLLARWLYEPERWPELSLQVNVMGFDARGFERRILLPLEGQRLEPFELRASGNQPELMQHAWSSRLRWQAERFALNWEQSYADSTQRLFEANAIDTFTLKRSQERWLTQQLWLDGTTTARWQWRAGLDFGVRQADFSNQDALELRAFYPPESGIVVTPGVSRILETASAQKITRSAGQMWLGRELGAYSAFEIGLVYAREQRRDQASLLRSLNGTPCRIRDLNGQSRDCAVDLPEIRRLQVAKQSEPLLTPAITLVQDAPGIGRLALQWRRGARSGGARPFAGSIRAFKPERSETYELSLRRDPAPEVQARIAVFYNDWRDRQVQLLEPGQSSFTIENAGAAHAYGAEAQIQFALAEHWQAGFSMGWLQTQFDRFPIASASDVVDLAGNRFTRAPRRTALLHALYAPTRGLQAGAQWRYADQVEGDAFNRASTRLPSFHTVDLRVGWQAANWNLALNLENALDRRYLQQVEASLISPDPRAFVLAPRRNIALELGFRW